MIEIWKDIPGYEKLYQASNWGRIRSLKYGKVKILKLFKRKDGYLHVRLCKDGKGKMFYIHRLVWITFNGEIPEEYEVNHINEDKTDCSLDNLNLLTHKANNNWGTRNEKVSVAMTNGKLSDPVLQLTLDEKIVNEWPSMAEAHRNGYKASAVCRCCMGKLKTYKGFKWIKKINYIK